MLHQRNINMNIVKIMKTIRLYLSADGRTPLPVSSKIFRMLKNAGLHITPFNIIVVMWCLDIDHHNNEPTGSLNQNDPSFGMSPRERKSIVINIFQMPTGAKVPKSHLISSIGSNFCLARIAVPVSNRSVPLSTAIKLLFRSFYFFCLAMKCPKIRHTLFFRNFIFSFI